MSEPIVYWYVLDFHWEDQSLLTAALDQLKLRWTFDVSVTVPETHGVYRLLAATLNPKLESLARIALGPKIRLTVLTDFDEMRDYVSLYCVQRLVDASHLIGSSQSDLYEAMRQEINRQLFI